MKCVSKHEDLQIFVLKINKYEFVDRGSETQTQVVDNLNKLPQQDKGYNRILELKGFIYLQNNFRTSLFECFMPCFRDSIAFDTFHLVH